MSATVPLRASPTDEPTDEPEIPTLEGPKDLVDEYLRLVEQRRAIEDRLSYVRAELEMAAAHQLKDERPRGRFLGASGGVSARLSPSCTFDRAVVARELQRMGKLAEVAILQGPGLARYLAREPVVAARLGGLVRPRRSVTLIASDL